MADILKEVKHYKSKSLPSVPVPDAILYIKSDTDAKVTTYITDINGIPYPLKDDNTIASGVQTVFNTDGTISVIGTDNVKISLHSSLLALINSSIQPTDLSTVAISGEYNDLLNIPADFTPSAHTHPISDVIGLQVALDSKVESVTGVNGVVVNNTDPKNPIVGISGTKAQYNTSLTDGDFLFVGDISQYTDEQAQDSIGTILTDSSTIDFTYDDTTPSILANVKPNSITPTELANNINLTEFVNDAGFETTSQLNVRDTNNRNRVNHTGTQLASTISDFTSSAKTAVVNNSITDGVIDKAPSENAVFDALTLKQDNLVSGTSIKTLENQSLLGSGNIDLNKSDVGLSNVDNTSDASKPVSTVQQNALDLKANIIHSLTHELGGTDVIQGENLSVNVIPPTNNYSPVTSTLKGHLQGIDQALGSVVQTTAGLTNRIYYTADVVNISGTNYYASSANNKGVATEAIQIVVNGDNTKSYFTQDVISVPQPFLTTAPAGSFAGQLSVRVDNDFAQERYTVEIYKTNNSGIPIASGITGAPIGNLGVTVVAILDSGIIDLVQNSTTNIPISGVLNSNLTLNIGERLRYHISAEKIGIAGGNFTFSLYLGNAHNSYYDVPVTFNTDTVSNRSLVTGITASDALNYLDANKENIVNKVTDIATGANNTTYPTSLAVKTYADNLVVGMLNDRGTWDASANLFPTTGGSGAAGAIRKGDMWYVSIAGTLGGKSVNVGDSFRALVNAPAQVASNWSVLESNIGYVPANDLDVVHKTGNVAENVDGNKTFTNNTFFDSSIRIKKSATIGSTVGYNTLTSVLNKFIFVADALKIGSFDLGNLTETRSFVLPDQSGTFALTSDLSAYEPTISPKNSAFNKNFGTTAGTVAEGNDSRFTDARNPLPNSSNYIQNQNSSAQSANMWISGDIKIGPYTYNDNGLTIRNAANTSDLWSINKGGGNGSEDWNFYAFNRNSIDFSLSSSTGAATFLSTVTAPTFVGNLNGNATNWGNRTANFDTVAPTLLRLTGVDNADGVVRQVNSSVVQSWLGLGSNAYTSTAYLPLSGGNISDAINFPQRVNGNTSFEDIITYGFPGQKSRIQGFNNYADNVGAGFRFITHNLNNADVNSLILDTDGKATFASTVTASPATVDTQLATLGQAKALKTSILSDDNTFTGSQTFNDTVSFNNLALLKSYTVATLPTGLIQGSIAYVTDGLTPTYRATATGGGSEKCLVFYDGTVWRF